MMKHLLLAAIGLIGCAALDRRSDGTGERHQRQLGPAHLEGARASAAP
jgi:hypothetical protein